MNDNLIERAERLLAGTTPGRWWWTNETSQRLIAGGSEGDLTDARELIRCAALHDPDNANAEFIAAAPELVAGLLAEVKRLTPRVIETVAELDALPAGAVVRENGPYPEAFVYEKYLDETECDYRWVYPGDSDPQIEPPLPAAVLYVPEGGDRG